jgi:hypothetical protein
LGKNPTVEKVEIRWTNGRVQVIEKPVVGQVNKVKE